MRDKIIVGNWKMNNDNKNTEELLTKLKSYPIPINVRTLVAPSFTQLSQCVKKLEKSKLNVAAQNMNAEDSGAYTGEISAGMLKGIGVTTVILGHSERRSLFHETDFILEKKVNTALKEEMEIIFCFGEKLPERNSNKHFEVVTQQLKKSLFSFPKTAWRKINLAYEPVWAIGTGETASPGQAQEMHNHIRKLIAENYDQETADCVSILYGGSVKPSNAQDIFKGPDVDGGLIGGASLNADDFMAIVNAF